MIRLGQLAAAIANAGRQPLPGGARLTELTLTVAVSESPELAQGRLWRLAVAKPAPRWRDWLEAIAGRWRTPQPPWPLVTLTWSQGRVYASLTPISPMETFS